MGLEREKKYLVDEEKAAELKNLATEVIGVVQWYVDSCDFFGVRRPCRLRYTVDEDGHEEWVVAFKGELREDFVREEEEHAMEHSLASLNFVSGALVAAKLRYFLMFEPAEVVLDEFIALDVPYRHNVRYMVEIETMDHFEHYEKLFNLTRPLSLEEFEEYTNKNLAIRSSLRPEEIIELVKDRLFKTLAVLGRKR